MILSVTFVPAAVALWVTGEVKEKESRWMLALKNKYADMLNWAYQFKYVVATLAVGILIISAAIFTRVGSEFAPQLSEGDFALQLMRAPSTGIEESLKIQEQVEKQLLQDFPEVKAIFARTGTAEVATDVMPPNISDAIVLLNLVNNGLIRKKALMGCVVGCRHMLNIFQVITVSSHSRLNCVLMN
jgi:cobalt-zinc-cadmium resistance protein CzcA